MSLGSVGTLDAQEAIALAAPYDDSNDDGQLRLQGVANRPAAERPSLSGIKVA